MDATDVTSAPQTLILLRERIARACERAGRDVREVTLIGASKRVDARRLPAFFAAGLRVLGENYVQEGVAKREQLQAQSSAFGVSWHLIGGVQSNKARAAISFDLIHSLDRASLARALNAAAQTKGKTQNVLLQVNLGDEDSKNGCDPGDVAALAALVHTLPNLNARGLMCLPPFSADADKTRPYFAQLRSLRDAVLPGGELSMGMSNDFEVAIEEGATLIRVGTALFGAREAE